MRSFHVRLKAERANPLGSGRADGSDDQALETAADGIFDPEIAGNLKKVRNLDGGSEKDHIEFTCGDRFGRLLEGSDIFGKRPLIDGNRGDNRAALAEP